MSSLQPFTKATFEALKQTNDTYLFDFWAPWCGPCKVMNPILEKLSADSDLASIKFGQINVDDEIELATEFNVTGIPNFILMRFDSQTQKYTTIKSFVGVQDPLSFKMKLIEATKA